MLKFIIIWEIGNRDTDSGSNYPKKKRRELIWRRCQRVTVYCIICVQWIYQKAFLNCLCQYLSFLNIFPIDFARWKNLFQIDCVNIYLFSIFFFNRFCPAEKSGVPPYCFYRDFSTLTQHINMRTWKSWAVNSNNSIYQ